MQCDVKLHSADEVQINPARSTDRLGGFSVKGWKSHTAINLIGKQSPPDPDF